VNGELAPDHRRLRISDAEREQVMQRLHSALGEGRLTMVEFEERVDGVLAARTYGEVEVFLADLPTAPVGHPQARDVVQLRNHASSLKRRGRWIVPRRLVVESKAGSVKLDFAEAVITQPIVEVDLDVIAGSTHLILPDGASADVDDVQVFASSISSKVPSPHDQVTSGPRFVIRGCQKAGSLKIRYRYRFWRWSW
jgi:hypothetical protein